MSDTPRARRVKPADLPPEVRAKYEASKARHAEIRAEFAHKPGIHELFTAKELADAAPFYFALIGFVAELKRAREAAGLTLVQVAEKTGLAAETLSRLENGMVTNPTWKTLGLYAVAVGSKLHITAEA